MYNALLSRSTVFEFKPLTAEETRPAVERALRIEQERSDLPFQWEDTVPATVAAACGGDVRKAVTAVELQDPPEGPQPSLILRRMAEGETLWDIARQYRTDEEAIRAANELTEDRPEGMLLIPRVR